MKRRFLTLVMAFLCFFTCFAVACGDNGVDSTLPVPDLVRLQAHEQKVGYKFCGYFYDEALTRRVYKTFDSVPDGYYAKYQLDREQLFPRKDSADTSMYTMPMSIDQVIYAENYMDAIERYKEYTHFMRVLSFTDNKMKTAFHYYLGENEYTRYQVYNGAKDDELNKFYDFQDTYSPEMSYMDGVNRYKSAISRNTKWKAYLGKASVTEDGVRYYIVNNEYAVIVGLETEAGLESFTLPSKIEDKPVTQVSITNGLNIAKKFNVKQLTVPSSVKNAMIHIYDDIDSDVATQTLEKIVFEEGIQTIQLLSAQTEEVVIPSTAYYVDLCKYDGAYAYESIAVPDQKITVNGGEHYYTKNGMLCSKEGDLVHQFAGRENIALTIDGDVRRVLRRSINGLAKTITIPSSVLSCDVFFNENSLRFDVARRSQLVSSVPVVFLKSKTVAEQWLNHYKVKENCFALPCLKNLAGYVVLDESIQLDGMDSVPIVPSKIKIEGNVIYSKQKYVTPDGAIKESADWSIYSYLTEDFPKDDYSFDYVFERYYRYNKKIED